MEDGSARDLDTIVVVGCDFRRDGERTVGMSTVDKGEWFQSFPGAAVMTWGYAQMKLETVPDASLPLNYHNQTGRRA